MPGFDLEWPAIVQSKSAETLSKIRIITANTVTKGKVVSPYFSANSFALAYA